MKEEEPEYNQKEPGDFDNVGACQYDIPSHWDIGRVYKRLIKQVVKVSLKIISSD